MSTNQSPPIAGVDVSKEDSTFAIIDSNNQPIDSFAMLHNLKDIKQTIQRLHDLETQLGKTIVIVMEATSHYSKILASILLQAGFVVVILNPIRSHAIRNATQNRKLKSEKTDAFSIALAYRLKATEPVKTPKPERIQLRALCRDYWNLKSVITSYRQKLKSLQEQFFLLFEKAFNNPFSNTAFALAVSYPTPQALLAESESVLMAKVKKLSRKGETWAKTLVNKLRFYATLSLSLPLNCGDERMQSFFRIIQTLEQEAKMILRQIKSLVQNDPEYQLLLSIPGIGPIIAATILGEIGDFSWFKISKQLVAFSGIDPSVYETGKFRGTRQKMSKRGSNYLRYVIYLATLQAVSKTVNGRVRNPVLRARYEQKKAEGKKPRVALGACMHTMVAYIFATLRDRQPFQIRTPEEHREWFMNNRIRVA